MLKRVLTITLAVVLIMTVLAACGGSLSKPNNGTYRSEDGLQSWTFTGSNKITLSISLISMNGTYEIKGDRMTVTTTGLLGSTSGYTITEITSKSFFIDGTKFVKQ
ncbi:MAG: hypothetical protein LBK23_02430 [Oscillospiraceae bacterium]|nr:hypothetical protein [Oscillospiraceae bacterium]